MSFDPPTKQSFATCILLESITRSAYSERAPGQLQPLQWSIIRYLRTCDEEFATVGYTARFLGLSHAPVSRSIATLRKKELLSQFEHPYDARGAVFKLTQKGEGLATIDPLIRVANIIDDLPQGLKADFQLAVEQVVMKISTQAHETS